MYRIYVDGIINHMTGMGRSGQGTAGTNFDADNGDFPGVPYSMSNFNGCETCPECCCIQVSFFFIFICHLQHIDIHVRKKISLNMLII